MNRRKAVCTLAALGMAVPAAWAQPAGKVYRIGYLSTPTRKSVERIVDSFLLALRNLGWVEGKNLLIEYRWADGNVERLPALAADLVRLKADLIVAPAVTAVRAAKNATTSIPIVMIFPNDPVASGFVASLRQPGGNITGTVGSAGLEIVGKQLQLLQEIDPRISRVTFLWDPTDADSAAYWQGLKEGRLLLQHCLDCGHIQFYQQAICRQCTGERLEHRAASGLGTVHSFSVVYRAPGPAFKGETPYAVLLVELDEGPRMISSLVGADVAEVHFDMRVELICEQVSESIALPRFKPV